MGKVNRAAKAIFDFALHIMRRATPFFICLFGMSAPVLFSPGNVWVGMLIAGAAFAWALDMAEMRAAAEAQADIATKLIATLTNGHDTNINVIYQPAALSEEQG